MELRLFTVCAEFRGGEDRGFDLLGIFNTLECAKFPCSTRFVVFTEWEGANAERGLAQLFYIRVTTDDGVFDTGDQEGRVVMPGGPGVLLPTAQYGFDAEIPFEEPGYYRVQVLDADHGLLAEKRILLKQR